MINIAYYMIAVIVDNSSQIAKYRILDTSKSVYRDIDKATIIKLLSSGSVVENLKLKDNSLIPVGSIQRYPHLSLQTKGAIDNKQACTVISAGNGKATVCSAYVKQAVLSFNELSALKLTNAKLVKRDNKLILSSLSGSSIKTDTAQAQKSRKYSLSRYTPDNIKKWEYTWHNPTQTKRVYSLSASIVKTHKPGKYSKNKPINSKLKQSIKEVGLKKLSSNDTISVACYYNGPIMAKVSGTVTVKASGNSVYINKRVIELLQKTQVSIGGLLYFCVDEYSDGHGGTYLVLNGLLEIPLVVLDILHIGKGFIKVGSDDNAISEDNTIVCLGLMGLIVIEAYPDGYVNSTSYRLSVSNTPISKYCDITCIPYKDLTSKESIYKSLEYIDIPYNISSDLDLILNAAKNRSIDMTSTNDITKLTLSEVCNDSRYSTCKASNAVLGIYEASLQNPVFYIKRLVSNRKGANFYCSIMLELVLSVKDPYYILEDEEYSNITDFEHIRDFGGGIICMAPSYSFKSIGYIALNRLNRVGNVYPEMASKDIKDKIDEKISRIEISNNKLKVMYGLSIIVEYDLNSLIGLYNLDSANIQRGRDIACKVNAKHSLLGDGLVIDANGFITDFGSSHIRQSSPIRGIKLSPGKSDRTTEPRHLSIEVTDKFIIDRDSSFSSAKISLIFGIDTLDCIHKLELGLWYLTYQYGFIESIIFDLDGIDNYQDLKRVFLVYLGCQYSSSSKDLKYYINGIGIHGNRFLYFNSNSKPSKAAIDIILGVSEAILVNVDKVDISLRIELMDEMIDISKAYSISMRESNISNFLSKIKSYLIPEFSNQSSMANPALSELQERLNSLKR